MNKPGKKSRFKLYAPLMLGTLCLFSTFGCGNNRDGGIILKVEKSDSGLKIPEGPEYVDEFLTPSEVRIGLKSAKLIKADETTPSYTIFDTLDPKQPHRWDLTTLPEVLGESVTPGGCPCTYSKIQFEIIFVDVIVPTYSSTSSTTATNKRFRFYTEKITDPPLGFEVEAGDLLFGNASEDFGFQWINLENGDPIPLSGTRPDPNLFTLLKVPPARFLDDTYSSKVTVDLNPFLDIPEDADKKTFTVTATFQVGNLFVYDDTNANARFELNPDGNLNANEPDSRYSSTFPRITASTN